jgi:hypothetical protein
MAINNYKHNLNEPLVVKDLQITGTRVDNQNTLVFTKSIQLSADNTSGGGLLLGDEGDFVDLNTGFGAFRFTSGISVYSASRGGSPVIQLESGGNINFVNVSGTTTRGVIGSCGNSDFWFFGGGATADNAGFAQISTSDDGNEPIYVRQYIGDPRNGTLLRTTTLLDGSGNTLINNTTATGTASQPLQVTGGAYVSGGVGIGVTNPGAKLDVSGDIRLSGADPEIEFNNGGPRLKVPSANTLTIHTGGELNTTTNELVRINNTGVGIGTTNPVATLQVKDALAFETTNTTTSSTSQVAVDTFATATFRSAKYQVQMTCPGQIATLGGITTGGRGYTAGTFNVTFSNSSGTGAAAQGTLTISNGTVSQIGVGTTGGSGYTAGDVLTAAGGSGLQVSVGSTASPSGAILTLGSITSAGIGYTAGVGVGTTTVTFLGGTGTGAVGLATIFDGVITSSTLLQQPTTGTGGTVFYSGSNYTTSTVLTIAKTDVTNTITDIAGSVGVSTFTSLTSHGIGVSDTVRVSSTSNGLTAGTNYFVVTTPSTTTFTLGSSVGIGTTFTTGSSLSIGFYRNSANAGGSVAYLNAITGVSTNFQVSDLLVLQNGTTADFVEYGTIANNDVLGTFAADISGANTRLLVTPTYATNTVKVARQAITV